MATVGDFVELHGLKNAAQHNSKQGRVFEIREDGRLRLTVMSQLEGHGRIAETLAVKPANAKKIRNYYTEDFLTEMFEYKMIMLFGENGQPRLPRHRSDLPIEVRRCELGVGLFVKRGGSGVPSGTDLFQERPLFSVGDDLEFEASDETLMRTMTSVDASRNQWEGDYVARMLLTGVEGPKLPVDEEVPGLHNWPAAVIHSRRFTSQRGSEDGIIDIRPLCSLLNHSCSPSAVVSPLGVVTVWKDLGPGEEITIAYCPGDLLQPSGQRYAFGGSTECRCSVCRQPEELRRASDARRQQLRERADKWFADGCPGEELDNLQKAMAVEGLSLETAYPRATAPRQNVIKA